MNPEMNNINQAFLEAQKKIKAVKKDGTNPFFHSRYATLQAVVDNVKDNLNDVGISILQPIMGDKVVTRLLFTDGTSIEDGGTPIVCKVENDPQAQGSAITYARRYGLMSILSLPADDDDAESATIHKTPQATPSERKPITTSQASDEALTAGQRKYLYVIMKSEGLSQEDFCKKHGISKLDDLSKPTASEIINSFSQQSRQK